VRSIEQCSRSVTFWCRSAWGSGSSDPNLWLTNQDVRDVKGSFTFTSFFKDKSHKEVSKSVEIKIFLHFLLVDGRIRIRIRIRNTGIEDSLGLQTEAVKSLYKSKKIKLCTKITEFPVSLHSLVSSSWQAFPPQPSLQWHWKNNKGCTSLAFKLWWNIVYVAQT
jgi:hypothetical protein